MFIFLKLPPKMEQMFLNSSITFRLKSSTISIFSIFFSFQMSQRRKIITTVAPFQGVFFHLMSPQEFSIFFNIFFTVFQKITCLHTKYINILAPFITKNGWKFAYFYPIIPTYPPLIVKVFISRKKKANSFYWYSIQQSTIQSRLLHCSEIKI